MSTLDAPWPEPTVQVPQRIKGWYVVAVTKLPASTIYKNRYVAVVQANPASLGFTFYPLVTWYPQRGFEPVHDAVNFIPYDEAIVRYVDVLRFEFPTTSGESVD